MSSFRKEEYESRRGFRGRIIPALEARNKIPNPTIVHCPLVKFEMRNAHGCCPTCPYFEGLHELHNDISVSFQDRHFVLCSATLSRKLTGLA